MASLVLLVVGMSLATTGQLTHAAVSGAALRRQRKFPLAWFYRDTDGNALDSDNSFVAKVSGSSCECVGIRNGTVVVAQKFDSYDEELSNGDVVIINSEKADGSRPHRFRRIVSVEAGIAHFASEARQLKSKPLSDIIGVVTHVRD